MSGSPDSKAQGRRAQARRPRIGLALAGGGTEGAIYEIGALRAIEEALEGVDLNDLQVYVGVSAGALVASCLANGITPRQMCEGLVIPQNPGGVFLPDGFFAPALSEWGHRALRVPRLSAEAAWDYISNLGQHSLFDSLTRLGRALPVGLFDNEPIRAFLQCIFTGGGRTDDFRELAHRLIVVAADLDSGEAVRFGGPGKQHIPISRAVQASTALPGLYSPVEIEGRSYVDGVLLKTLHASVALEAGVDFLLCLNPIVPVDTAETVERGVMRRGRLIHRGLPAVLSQTFRTLVHSRLSVGMASYAPRFPGTDVVLIEPRRDDYRMFFTNVFRFSSRKAVCAYAYAATRRDLLRRYDELSPILARHGMRLNRDVLEEPERDLLTSLEGPAGDQPLAQRLDQALTRLERHLDQKDEESCVVS